MYYWKVNKMFGNKQNAVMDLVLLQKVLTFESDGNRINLEYTVPCCNYDLKYDMKSFYEFSDYLMFMENGEQQ